VLLAGDARCPETAIAVGRSVGRSVVSSAVAIRAGVVTAVTRVSVDRPAASAVVCHAISLTGTGLQVVSLSAPLQ